MIQRYVAQRWTLIPRIAQEQNGIELDQLIKL
jgi:hypothetical protein